MIHYRQILSIKGRPDLNGAFFRKASTKPQNVRLVTLHHYDNRKDKARRGLIESAEKPCI